MDTPYASKHGAKSSLAKINHHLHHNINGVEHVQNVLRGGETYEKISNIMSSKKTYMDKRQVPQARVLRRPRGGFFYCSIL